MTRNISLSFGALADPLVEQLNRQGLTLSEKDGKLIEDLNQAVIMTHLHGLFPDSACHKAHQKLMKKIMEMVIPLPEGDDHA